MESTQEVVYFFGEKKKNGYFSQFYPCEFIDENEIKYNCCEQFMMAMKAKVFKDETIMNKILEETSPIKIKKLGRLIKNFNEQIWDENKREIVFTGNYLKFNQNPELKEKLLETNGKQLAEASPYDKIWGIGISEKDARGGKEWKGQNLLGKALMEVREILNKYN
jgi:ribA/ribD-fused uncharacterized protein